MNRFPPLIPRYNIAPSQNVVAIVERNAEREAVLLEALPTSSLLMLTV